MLCENRSTKKPDINEIGEISVVMNTAENSAIIANVNGCRLFWNAF